MATLTYTPSATWHNTTSEQEVGDVSDPAVIFEGGQYAMDNIAYLTGGNTSTQVTRLRTETDLTGLKAIGTSSRRDLDFCVLDTANGERLYKFDSSSSSTGDDYAVVTPASGSGRWHLVNAKPKSTTLRRVIAGMSCVEDSGDTVTRTSAAQDVYVTHPATGTVWGRFDTFNVGDVISEIELVGFCSSSNTLNVEFFHVASADSGTSPTVTSLGTLSISGGGINTTTSSSSAPLPVTMAEGDQITFKASFDASGGSGGTTAKLRWCAVNGTRSYITQ
jgi:hypothetical protein